MRKWLSKAGYMAVAKNWLPPMPKTLRHLSDQSVLISLIKRTNANIIFDVGANHGWYAYNLRRSGFTGRIVTFEPIAANCDIIANRMASDPDWIGCDYALGSSSETKSLNVLNDPDGGNSMSSFLDPTIDLPQDVEEVEIQKLENVWEALTAGVSNPRIFLKLDTQGFDMEVLRGAGDALQVVVGLQSEVSVRPIYAQMPHYTEALAFYETLGFILSDLQAVTRTAHGDVIEYDCLMTKT